MKSRPDRPRFPVIVATVGGLFFLAFGLWAVIGPHSFFDAVAAFEPYDQHFVQDIGAFQVGLAAVLLLSATTKAPALTVALLGGGVASAAHVVSHAVGRDLGGTPETDIPVFAAVTVLLLAGAVVSWRGSELRP